MNSRATLLGLSVSIIFSAILVGAYVTVANLGDACGSDIPSDWPGCLGGVLPPPQFGPVMEYLHRITAALSTLFLFATTALYWRANDTTRATKRALLGACILLVAQILLGGIVIAQVEEAAVVAAHQGLAILTFGFAVAALVQAQQPH